MNRLVTSLAAGLAISLAQPDEGRAQGLEEMLQFYAQGAGNGMTYITQGLVYNAAQLTNLAPAATQAAMATGSTVAAGIAEVLQYDPAVRNVFAHRAAFYGGELGLRGQAFLEAMRDYALRGNVGPAAHQPFPDPRAGAATAEALIAVAGLAVVAGVTAFTIHEMYLAYEAELEAAGADADAYANNVRLLIERLADGRQTLCPGVDVPQALSAIRFNADAGRFPYLGVLEECVEPEEPSNGPAWRLAKIEPNPGNGPLRHETNRVARSCTPPPARVFEGDVMAGVPVSSFFLIDHRRQSTIKQTVNVTFAFRADLPRSAPPATVVKIPIELQVSGNHDSENASATGSIAGYRGALNVMSCSLVGCGGNAPAIEGSSQIRFPSATSGRATFEIIAQLSDGAGSPVGANCKAIYTYRFEPGAGEN